MSTADLACFADRLDRSGTDPTAEPLGWVCRTCGGRASAAQPPPEAIGRVLDQLAESAAQHARTCR